jgi:hypothetical protein
LKFETVFPPPGVFYPGLYTIKISKRFLIFLGSEPSKTEEKHLLPNPEFSSVLSGDCKISFVNVFSNVLFITDFVEAKMSKK